MKRKKIILIVCKGVKQREKIINFLRLLCGPNFKFISGKTIETPNAIIYIRNYNCVDPRALRVDEVFILQNYETDLDVLNSIRCTEVYARLEEENEPRKQGFFKRVFGLFSQRKS